MIYVSFDEQEQEQEYEECEVIVQKIDTWQGLIKLGGDVALYVYDIIFDTEYERKGHWYFRCLAKIWQHMKLHNAFVAVYADGTIGMVTVFEFTVDEWDAFVNAHVEKHFEGINNIVDAKKLFRKLAKENHPDLGGCAEKFRKIEEEYRLKIQMLEMVNA